MRAVHCREYGPPEVLQVAEVEAPVPGDAEVLLAVRAAGVNPLDGHLSRGRPWPLRLFFGLARPRDPRVGRDVAGVVEAVGRGVTELAPGDAVFGSCRGAFAERAVAAPAALAKKPPEVTFEQAAAVAVPGYTALQGLRDHGGLRAGQHVLVNGAGGGVGTFAVQIAKALGAEVTAACSAGKAELVRTLGADRVIDREREDFTRGGRRYDLILDCWATRPLLACGRALVPAGSYVVVGGPIGSVTGMLAGALGAWWLSLVSGKRYVQFVAKPNPEDLETLRDLLAGGRLTPLVERSYRLEEAAEAVRCIAQGQARGKLVLAP